MSQKSSLKMISICLRFIVFSILALWFALRLHIDWYWFSQFNLESVILKRWGLQIIFFAAGLIIILLSHRWLVRWNRIETIQKEIYSNSLISGRKYGLYLISSVLTHVLLSALIIQLLFYTLRFDPRSIVDLDFSNFLSIYSLLTVLLLYFLSIIKLGISKAFHRIYLLVSLLLAFVVSRSWSLWSLALTIPNSEINEKVFNSDISFGIGRYPALIVALLLLLLILIQTISTAFSLYFLKNHRISDWRAPILTSSMKRHVKPLFAIITFTIGALVWFSRYQFLLSDQGSFTGASWLDVHLNIPLRSLSAILILITGIFLLLPSKITRGNFLRIIPLSAVVICWILEFLFTPIFQWILVNPRELNLEKPYIKEAIKATRRAFQLDSIATRLINPNPQLSKLDLKLGEGTLRNIRLWDSQPLLATNRQLQQLRVYYRFSNASVDRYQLKADSDERQQVMITARELDQEALPITARTWINRHFVFTHGYGFTLSPVNTKAPDGLPDYFIRDLGKSTKIEGSQSLSITKNDVATSIPIGRAALYYGILPSPYAIAPTKLEEFDYPEGDQNIYNHYSGTGGIPLNTLINKIAAAFYLVEPRLLNTGVLTNQSRLLLHRDVKRRINILAPFISLIGEPYLISTDISQEEHLFNKDQKQFWIVEGYTSATTYPYSERPSKDSKIRYIRNSVKAVVDAYSGKIQLYISEPKDPIVNGWKRLFPELFQPLNKMPIGIQEHLKVPTDLFNVKVQQLLKYHVTDPKTFYNGDDFWQVPMELYGSEQVPVEPYHITAQLGDNEKSEFLLLQPLTPLARPNLSAWLAARSDGMNYGKLVLLRFPSQTTIFGPEQIQALINQNPEISQQFSLWDRAGSEVIQGNLLVLPLGNALLYVEPVYLKASMGGLPTLTRIVVSDGKKVVMHEDLSGGLKELLDYEN